MDPGWRDNSDQPHNCALAYMCFTEVLSKAHAAFVHWRKVWRVPRKKVTYR